MKHSVTDSCLDVFEKTITSLVSEFKQANTSYLSLLENSIHGFAYGFGLNNPLSLMSEKPKPAVRNMLFSGASQPVISLRTLVSHWGIYKQNIKKLSSDMCGVSPMLAGLKKVDYAFKKAALDKLYSSKILIILSDGMSSDATTSEIIEKINRLKENNVVVITLHVSNHNSISSKKIYGEAEPSWSSGAELMFNCASDISRNSFLFAYLREHGWSTPQYGKLFIQINRTNLTKSFARNKVEQIHGKRQATAPKKNNTVFIAYSHEDRVWLDKLKTQLKPLETKSAMRFWADKNIKGGDYWRDAAEHTLMHTQVAILLISPAFLNSEFIAGDRLPELLERAKTRGTTVIPLMLKPSQFSYNKSLRDYVGINSANNPLCVLLESDQDKVLFDLAIRVEKALRDNRNTYH